MFEIEGTKNPDEIAIKTASKTIVINVAESTISADLPVGVISGPGEFEIGEATIRGIGVGEDKSSTIYDVEVSGVHVGITGGIEDGLDDLGISDVLCTTSVRAVREISPKLVIAMGNVDGMVTELKLTAKTEKKLKVKKIDDLPAAMEVVVLN
ncbi:hypothetical protein IJ768_02110 [Candidatus Saccharibacteria bacterium]|nr:hypothetical protein [Candidatus Saccharibacteria bacterium]